MMTSCDDIVRQIEEITSKVPSSQEIIQSISRNGSRSNSRNTSKLNMAEEEPNKQSSILHTSKQSPQSVVHDSTVQQSPNYTQLPTQISQKSRLSYQQQDQQQLQNFDQQIPTQQYQPTFNNLTNHQLIQQLPQFQPNYQQTQLQTAMQFQNQPTNFQSYQQNYRTSLNPNDFTNKLSLDSQKKMHYDQFIDAVPISIEEKSENEIRSVPPNKYESPKQAKMISTGPIVDMSQNSTQSFQESPVRVKKQSQLQNEGRQSQQFEKQFEREQRLSQQDRRQAQSDPADFNQIQVKNQQVYERQTEPKAKLLKYEQIAPERNFKSLESVEDAERNSTINELQQLRREKEETRKRKMERGTQKIRKILEQEWMSREECRTVVEEILKELRK